MYVIELQHMNKIDGLVIRSEDKESIKDALIEKLNEGFSISSSYLEGDDSNNIKPFWIMFNEDNKPIICDKEYCFYVRTMSDNNILSIRKLKQILNDIDEEYLDLPIFSFPNEKSSYVGLCSVYEDNPKEYGLIIQ